MSSGRSPFPLVLLMLCLVGLAAGLFWWVNTLNSAVALGTPTAPPTSLHEAARTGSVPAIETSLKAGGAVDGRLEGVPGEKQGTTPLMLAAQFGHLPAAEALLAANAKVDATTRDGWTALMFAASAGRDATVARLLDSGAAINARSLEGWTALMLACARGSAATVQTLVSKGADTTFRNKWGQNATILAARSGDPEKLRAILVTSPDLNIADNDGHTALTAAAEADAPADVISMLIAARADVNRADSFGVTPLMRAADRGNVELARLLLAAGARTDLKDANGQTALDWANLRGDDAGKAVAELLAAK